MRIVLSGSIASGKTSQISRLLEKQKQNKKLQEIEIVPEPVDEWLKEGWLQKFYANPKEHAYGFQMRVLESQMTVPEKVLIERSPHTTERIFSKQLHEDGFISPEQFQSIVRYNQEKAWKPDAFIYLRTDPKECYRRIQLRSRESENKITLEYLEKLHRKHDELHGGQMCVSYLINGNLHEDEVAQKLERLMGHLIEGVNVVRTI